MLSGSLFSHHQGRFQPKNHFINNDGSSTPASSPLTREHLAVDVDPRTPTLRRYTKFNMSTNNFTHQRRHGRRNDNNSSELPLIKIEQLDDDRKNNPNSERHRQPHQFTSNVKFDVLTNHISSDRKNWMLMDKGVELRSASVNRAGCATSFSWLWLDDHSKKKSSRQDKKDSDVSPTSSKLHNKHLTLGNLKLFKSNLNNTNSRFAQPIADRTACDHHCCECSTKVGQTQNSAYSKTLPSCNKLRPTILPQMETVMIDEKTTVVAVHDNYHTNGNDRMENLPRSPTSTSSSSKSSNTSSNSNDSGKCHLSCPDLLQPCLNREASSDSLLSSTLSRNKTKKKNERKLWKNKQLECWNLDDVLLWLQSVGLEDVTSLLIGYEIAGGDLEHWNHTTLIAFGITDETKRKQILFELQKLKTTLAQYSPRVHKKSSSQRGYSLFPLINDSKYNVILTLELPITTSVRDFTIATDPMEYALIVTSCKPNLPLIKGDLIIELNGISCIKLPPVDFNKILHELSGHKYQLVILRKVDAFMNHNEHTVDVRL